MASTFAGTQKLHSFRPVDKETVIVKEFTSSNEEYVKKVSSRCAESPVLDEDIHGYVLVAYLNDWYLGTVTNKDPIQKTLTVNFLHPKGPSKSFKYPDKEDVLDEIPFSDVLAKVGATTATGRAYKVDEKSPQRASRLIKQRVDTS